MGIRNDSIEGRFGSPNKIIVGDGLEIYVYKSGFRLTQGILVWSLVPFPLAIPGGENEFHVVFAGNKVKEIIEIQRGYGSYGPI